MTLRAEHDSLQEYLEAVLTREQLKRPLLTNFNHWSFAQGALAETALTLVECGSEPLIAFWADKTPMLDVSWEASRAIGSILGKPTREAQLQKALIGAGISSSAFLKPPIRRWSPQEPLRIPAVLNRTNIRTLTYRGGDCGRAILQVHPDRNTPVTDEHLWPREWVEAAAESFAYVYDQTHTTIMQEKVTMLAVYNGRFLHDRAASLAAQSLGVPVVNYDLGGLDTDFDLTIDDTHDWEALQQRMLRMYAGWDPEERDQIGSEWFVDRTQHLDKMNSLFVEAQKIGSMVQLPKDKKIIVYFSSSGDEIIELDLDWDSYFGGQENALLTIAKICAEDPEIFLIVRSHPHKRVKPKHDVQQWLAVVDSASPDLHLNPHSDVDSYELMRAADLVITYGSTSGVEAAFAKRPVVVMGPSAYNSLGCATQVSSESELRAAIHAPTPGNWSGAVSYGLMMKRRGFKYSHITAGNEGEFSIGLTQVKDSPQIVKDLSSLISRWKRHRLT